MHCVDRLSPLPSLLPPRTRLISSKRSPLSPITTRRSSLPSALPQGQSADLLLFLLRRNTMIPAEVDVIVAGGGPAGCVVAGRIARADPNLQVCLVEAGASNYEGRSSSSSRFLPFSSSTKLTLLLGRLLPLLPQCRPFRLPPGNLCQGPSPLFSLSSPDLNSLTTHSPSRRTCNAFPRTPRRRSTKTRCSRATFVAASRLSRSSSFVLSFLLPSSPLRLSSPHRTNGSPFSQLRQHPRRRQLDQLRPSSSPFTLLNRSPRLTRPLIVSR